MEHRQAGPWHEPKPSDEGGILQPVESRIDVLHVTTKTPYKQLNFWGTYVAAGAGALAVYGGFVMVRFQWAQADSWAETLKCAMLTYLTVAPSLLHP